MTTTADKPLTATQLAGLRRLLTGPRSVWDFGSTTVNVLRKRGLATDATVNGGKWLFITDAGRAAAQEG